MPFPYFEILKKAYELARKNFWLWTFGLFIGGTANLNFGGLNYGVFLDPDVHTLEAFWESYQKALFWVSNNPEQFLWFVFMALVIGGVLMIVKGLSHAAVIWAANQFSKRIQDPASVTTPINFRNSLSAARKYLWRIIGLQILVTVTFLLLLAVIASPIIYLFSFGSIGRGIVLTLLGMAIFIPASLVFGFLHLYGPIFVVVFDTRIKEAVLLSFDLLRHKLKESLILGAVLVGLSVLFILGLIFSIILISFPVALLGLFFAKLEFSAALYTLVISGSIVGILYVIIMGAGFTIFQNITWVLAVEQMVKTRRFEAKDEDKALATETA